MTPARWRGTLIYTGTLAAMGTLAVVRFGPLLPSTAVDTTAGTSAAAAPGGAASTAGSTAGATTTSPTDTSGSTTTSGTVTITGSVVQTRYGPVQVAVTFTGDQIESVQTLQSPDSHRESQQINARATPLLAQEVVTAQSAQIDTVSGATYTSAGYRESVQSAIDQRG